MGRPVSHYAPNLANHSTPRVPHPRQTHHWRKVGVVAKGRQMRDWTPEASREQLPLGSEPYDQWVSPDGFCMAEFHRQDANYLVRFPRQCDFLLEPIGQGGSCAVTAWPAPDFDQQSAINLYHNAIQPLLGNHSGGLFLHGSAVRLAREEGTSEELGAVAFLGLSRGGKTTLAGSFARAGYPFLTEDVIDLQLHDGLYWLQPKRSKLRLFADSARFLLGDNVQFANNDMKQDVDAGTAFPFAKQSVPLRQIYVLGTDHGAPRAIRRFSPPEALTTLMPHAFILDVEDKARLKAHFARMADLARDVPCFSLDFPRNYEELPEVRRMVLENIGPN